MRFLATLMFISTIALLNTVSGALGAARYSQPSPADPAVLSTNPADPKLFDKVAFYPRGNLARALADLRITADRVALIVPNGDTYETTRKGQIATASRTTSLMVIAADRDLSIDAGQMAPTRHSPGLLNSKDLMVELLVKKSFLIENRVVWFAPDAGAVVNWDWKKDDEKAPAADMKGREAWHQLFNATTGDMRAEIGSRS